MRLVIAIIVISLAILAMLPAIRHAGMKLKTYLKKEEDKLEEDMSKMPKDVLGEDEENDG